MWLGGLLALAGLIAFIVWTPGGLLRKIDYVGAAVCHRRLSHSFVTAGGQLPLCQRCTGTFPGALTGVLVYWVGWRRRRSLRFPRWPFFVPLGFFAAFWGLDGLNSATSESQFYPLMAQIAPRPPGIGLLGYAPQPWLRLLTGALMGIAMSTVLVPAFNQSLWADGESTPTLRTWHELALLVAVALGMAALFLGLVAVPFGIVHYALSVYSGLGVLALFMLLGAMMFVLVMQRDGTLTGWGDAWIPLVWGGVFALFVILLMTAVRIWATGTIDGVPGLAWLPAIT